MLKVTIVLPNYNYAQYLDERIHSILNQTFTDFELIIIDDASTDNSLEVIQKYVGDPRVKTQFHIENSGLPYQRWNDGADLAQGKYLLIAGADDSCHPEMLEKLVEKLEAYPSAGLAYAQSWNIDGEGNKTHLWKEWTNDLDVDRWSADYINRGKDECKYLLYKNTIPNASAVLMRRSVFAEAGKFDTSLRLAADWMLWAKMLMISDIVYLSEPLNYFRTHSGAVRNTTKSILELEERLKVLSYIINNVQAERAFWETAYKPTLGWWVRTVLSGKMPIQKVRDTYGVLKEIDPDLNRNLLNYLAEMSKRKLTTLRTHIVIVNS